jgi:hypothetical protein
MHTACVNITTTLVTQLALQHMYTVLLPAQLSSRSFTHQHLWQLKRVSANQPVPCDATSDVTTVLFLHHTVLAQVIQLPKSLYHPLHQPSRLQLCKQTHSLPVINLLISIPPTILSRPLLHLPRLPRPLLLLTIACRRRQRQPHAAAILTIPPW